jgi:CAAX protease family protein
MLIALLLTYVAAAPMLVLTLVMPKLSTGGPEFVKHGLGPMILIGCLIGFLIAPHTALRTSS